MQNLLSNSWQGLAWRGAISLLFGILAALWPGITLIALMGMFSALCGETGSRCGVILGPASGAPSERE